MCCIEPIQGPKPFPEFSSDTVLDFLCMCYAVAVQPKHYPYICNEKQLWTWYCTPGKLEKIWKEHKIQRKQNFFRERDVPLMCGNLTATKFRFFLCSSSVFYIAVNFLHSCESSFFEDLLQHDMLQLLFQFHIIDP